MEYYLEPDMPDYECPHCEEEFYEPKIEMLDAYCPNCGAWLYQEDIDEDDFGGMSPSKRRRINQCD